MFAICEGGSFYIGAILFVANQQRYRIEHTVLTDLESLQAFLRGRNLVDTTRRDCSSRQVSLQ
jgi:hypothetical protein